MKLPSYQEAVAGPDIPSLIAPYLGLNAQQSASRVNRAWYKAMSRHIWADPLRSFSLSSRPFYQTAHFIEEAPDSRKSVRDLVTAIDFRPLLARRHAPALRKDFTDHELAIGFEWILRKCGLFQNLRFIILDGLTRIGWNDGIDSPTSLTSNTRVLLLSAQEIAFGRLENVINEPEFRSLMFLDLSYTCRPEDLNLPLAFSNLRILKLRGLRLTKVPRFILDLGTQLWSLDLTNNLISDHVVVLLVENCFAEKHPNLLQLSDAMADVHHLYDCPPVYHQTQGDQHASQDYVPLRPDSVSSFINYVTDNGDLRYHRAHVLSDTDPMYLQTGLTHLYISGNKLHSTIINYLLESQNRLQVLDVGAVRLDFVQIPYKTVYAVSDGCNNISPLFGCRLEQLRIHHSAVTQIPTILRSDSPQGVDLESLKQAEDMYDKKWPRFSPLRHHRLKSLTLTDIPTKSYGPIITQLTRLLEECSEQEQKLAAARAAMPQNRRAPQVLSGLRTLRLEFLPEAPAEVSSVSGDRDAEGFLARSLGDFSFFGGSGGAEWVEKKGKGREKGKGKEREVEVEDVVSALRVFRGAQKPAGWGGTLELVWPRGR